MPDQRPPVLAIVNSSPDTVDMLRHVLQRAGFVVVSAYTFQIRDGQIDLAAFMREHAPQVVIYDIAPPYEESWRLFLQLQEVPAMRGCRFVLTTTNIQHLRAIAGTHERLFEVIGKPYDLGRVVDAVQDALRRPPENE